MWIRTEKMHALIILAYIYVWIDLHDLLNYLVIQFLIDEHES
jgi:hypothetical protein